MAGVTTSGPEELPEVLTIADLCRVFGRSREWVRNLLQSGDGPPHARHGRSLFVLRDDFRAWFKKRARAERDGGARARARRLARRR